MLCGILPGHRATSSQEGSARGLTLPDTTVTQHLLPGLSTSVYLLLNFAFLIQGAGLLSTLEIPK